MLLTNHLAFGQERLPSLAVIARARPTDKSRLVKLAQELNLVVGMTGDGVNDSAALKHADVGFAMGSGAEVAKEAADIVILDDNIAAILASCKYGRTIYKSIQKFITFQSTVNLASGILTLVGPFLHMDFALTLVQLLWVNLVMDTLAALAFGGEPALARTMRERPIARSAAIITPLMWTAILWNGLVVAGLCLGFLMWDPIRDTFFTRLVPGHRDDIVFLTAFFGFFIFCTVFAGVSLRCPDTLNVFDHILENKGYILVMFVIFAVQIIFSWMFGAVLRTVGLTMGEWATVVAMAACVVPLDAVRKSIVFRFGRIDVAVDGQVGLSVLLLSTQCVRVFVCFCCCCCCWSDIVGLFNPIKRRHYRFLLHPSTVVRAQTSKVDKEA